MCPRFDRTSVTGAHSGRVPFLLFLLTSLVLLCAGMPVRAQSHLSFAGRTFLVTFPDTVRDGVPMANYPVPDLAEVIIFARSTAHVTLTARRYSKDVVVKPDSGTVVPLNERLPDVPLVYTTQPQTASSNILRIVSDQDIIVYCYFVTASGTEAFTALPVESWGTEYALVSMPTAWVYHRSIALEEYLDSVPAPAETIVIASEDNTHVTVRPGPLAGSTTPVSVTLQAGQAYLFETLQQAPSSLPTEDFSGSYLTADHPVGVISGTTRADNSSGIDKRRIVDNTIKNTLAEWLTPVEMHGQTFVYRSIDADAAGAMHEFVRAISSASGPTHVTRAPAQLDTIAPLGFIDFPALSTRADPQPTMALYADRPAEAMVITGTEIRYVGDASSGTASTQCQAMAELAPYERWRNAGQFYTPDFPTFLVNYVVIVADSNADVRLDGTPVLFQSTRVTGTAFKHALVQVWSGSHKLQSTVGTFSAIAYGAAPGVESYRPLKTKEGSEEAHATVYEQIPSLAYAYPVVSLEPATGLLVTTSADCDSNVVTIRAIEGTIPADVQTIAVTDAENMTIRTDTLRTPAGDSIVGFRVVEMPVDPAIDGFAALTITDAAGRARAYGYQYQADRLDIIPNPVDLPNVTPSVQQQIVVWIRNRNPYPVTIRSGLLESGFRGFRLKGSTPFPITLKPGDSVAVTLLFLRVDYDQTFGDRFIISGPCRADTLPLSAHTGKAPAPRIGGIDWGSRWLTTLNGCTKDDRDGYDTTVALFNAGPQDLTVASLSLVGADADSGFFRLDYSDPNTSVRSGALLRAGDTLADRLYQRVVFRPASERAYQCVIRLITDRGDTVDGQLEGVGIESHVAAAGNTFPQVDLSGGAPLPTTGTARISALPTRPLTITRLAIGGPGAASFSVDPADLSALPKTLAPGENWDVRIAFLPTVPGLDSARLVISGDQSRCDDSTAPLIGESILYAVSVEGYDFGTVLTCDADSGFVILVNAGSLPVDLTSIATVPATVIDAAATQLPVTVLPGDTLRIPIRLVNPPGGILNGTVTLSTIGLDGTHAAEEVATVGAHLTGGVLYLGAADDVHIAPGGHVALPFRLDVLDAEEPLPLRALTLRLRYNRSVLRLTDGGNCADLFRGTIFEGWSCNLLSDEPGEIVVSLKAPWSAPPLAAPAILMLPSFRGYLGNAVASEVSLDLIADGFEQCVQVKSRPGRITLDSICGLSYRLIEFTGAKYALEGNHPNPFNPSTTIDFSIGLDGPVRVWIVDARGREVALLLDGFLAPGSYAVTWDASAFPSGLYYCRLTSGNWGGMTTMMLVK